MAEHLAKRKELWEARKESGTTCSTLTGRGNKQFASDTADKTGASKQQINRSVARAEKVSEDIRDEIRGTELDKGTVLDDLARTPREQQRARLDEWRDGRKSKVDADVKAQAAHAVAEIIAESTPPDLWDGIKANLYAAGAANIANELTNIIGGSLMDKGGWG